MTVAPRRPIRCAIYTRKSTEEGLDQAFNSLDAQREACAAYVASQKHEGWTALPDRYDDGGFSGGSMQRPALTALLADIEAGKVDVVVVYKVDRLTRALGDFARIVAAFDAASVSFVSVTQAFNTTTSMGRLTLNVPLSFAQFEREVTAERIRDKIAASKARGMWMGGTVPFGYRVEARSLVPAPEAADVVRRIFARYVALGSVAELRAELDRDGLRTPLRPRRDGSTCGGCGFGRGMLYAMLANPVYVGRVRHKDKVHPGQHQPILDEALWQAAQERLAANHRGQAFGLRGRTPSPLSGRLVDPDGRKMRPTHTSKNGRRYRYYVTAALIEETKTTGARGWRIPAAELEAAAAQALAARLREPALASELLGHVDAEPASAALMLERIAQATAQLDGTASERDRLLRAMVTQATLTTTNLSLEARLVSPDDANAGSEDLPAFVAAAPIALQRRGGDLRIVLQGASAPAPKPDPALLKILVAARSRAATYLDPSSGLTVSDIARREAIDLGDASRSMQLAFLAPDLVERILDGTQPPALTAERLKRFGELPLLWEEQRKHFS